MSISCEAPSTTDKGYVLGGDALRILPGGYSLWTLRSLARKGRIGTLNIPGTKTRYSVKDLERLAAESVRPAEATDD